MKFISMRNYLYNRYFLILTLCCLAGCASAPVKGSLTAASEGAERPSFGSTYHYSVGVLHLLDDNLDSAIKEYEKAMSLDPQSSYLKTELISVYIERGEIQKAVTLSKEYLTEHPNNVNAHLLLGGLYLNRKDYKNAVAEYEKVIELDPTNTFSRVYLGTIYAETKNYKKALKTFQELIKTNPDHLTGNYYLAKILTDMKRYGEAEQSFKKTLAIKPSFEPALIDLGLLYEKEKKVDQAVELYRSFIDLYPPGTNVRTKLGEIFLRDHRLNDAEREFKRILDFDQRNREARLELGLLYLEKGSLDDAIGEFAILLDGDPNDQRARYLLASTYEEKKMHGKAIEGFKMIPPDSELYGNAQINIGLILKKDGRIAEAIEVMEKAVRTNRDMPGLYVYLSSLYEEDKKLSSAEGILKEGLSALPASIDLHYSLGVLYEKTNRFHESINEMEAVLKIDPENADALNFIGYTFADRGIRLDEAEKMIKRALTLKPGNIYMIDSLGWVYFRQNRMDLAIKYLKEASDGLPNDPTIAEHLGDAYTKAGQASEAVEVYKQALKLNPANGDLQKKLNELIKGKKP